MTDAKVGLCATCAHVKRVASGKGSTFYLCARSKDDPRYRKYPVLPVLRCEGWEPDEPVEN